METRYHFASSRVLFLTFCLATATIFLYTLHTDLTVFKDPSQRQHNGGEAGRESLSPIRSSQTNSCLSMNFGSNDTMDTGGCCRIPFIDPFGPEGKLFFRQYPTLRCDYGMPSVVYYDRGLLKIDQAKVLEKLQNQRLKDCRYRSLMMKTGGDFSTSESPWSIWFREEIEVEAMTEHFLVECVDRDADVVAKSYISALQEDQVVERNLRDRRKKHRVLHSPLETLSVLAIGIDGMSRQNVIRSLPQTRRFLLQQLAGFEFQGYSKHGMNTFPNLITMLTGKTEREHSAYWNMDVHFDVMDFIWDEYARAGYRTQLVLDSTRVTPFHCSKKGWTKPPVHHYIRPLVVASEADFSVRGNDSNCIGDVPEITHLTDYILQLATASNGSSSKPYFSFAFLTRLTHDDPHKAMMGDELYLQFFQKLHSRQLLNNTALFFFSDHGPRFGPSRRTVDGMFEERMPFCFLALPRWFLVKYPHINAALSANQRRLTSHFDLHATLKDILYFKGQSGLGDLAHKGISLFYQVPRERSCLNAGLHVQWCPCHQYTLVNVSDSLVQRIAKSFSGRISSLTHSVRHLCHSLRLGRVLNAMMIKPISPSEGWEKDVLYQVTIETVPGDGVYEGMFGYSLFWKRWRLVGEVLRLNMFQTQSMCINNPALKPFCYCTNMLNEI